LITVGALFTLAAVTCLAMVLLKLPFETALLLGSILVVSGPTVVIPMLHNFWPKKPLGEILRWEAILIDPVGVVLAVLVAEVVRERLLFAGVLQIIGGMTVSLLAGTLLGLLAGV